MRVRALIRLTLLICRRNWRRIAILSLGLCIALAFFTGSVASANAVAPSFLLGVLKDTPIDLVAYPRKDVDYHEVSDAIAQIGGVAAVETVFQARFEPAGLNLENGSVDEGVLFVGGVAPDINQRLSGLTVVDGDWEALAPGGAAVSASLAASLGLTQGSRVWINYQLYSFEEHNYVNVSVEVTVACTVEVNGTIAACAIPEYGRTYNAQYVLVHIDWAANLTGQLRLNPGYNYSSNFVQNIFVDRQVLINPFDIGLSLSRTKDLAKRIEEVNEEYNLAVYDYLSSKLELVQFYVQGASVGLGLFTLPLLAMAWYTIDTVSWIQRAERRREFVLFQLRGASMGQIRLFILVEALFAGLVAVTGGVLLGAPIGWILSFIVFPPSGGGPPLPFAIFAVSVWQPAMIAVDCALGIGMAWLCSASGLRGFEKADRNLRPELVDLVAAAPHRRLGIGWSYLVLVVGLVRIMLAVLGVPLLVPWASGNVLLHLIELFLYQVDFVWLPLSPVLVIVGAVIILVRQGDLLERVSALLVRGGSPAIRSLVPRRIVEQKENVLHLLGLVSGAVLLVTAASMILGIERVLFETRIPSDLPGVAEAEAIIQGLMHFGLLESIFVWLLSLTGVSYVIAAYMRSQRRQFALFAMRGATPKQLVHIIVTEISVVLAIASLLGATMGVAVAVGFHQELSFIRKLESFPIVFPAEGVLLTVVFLAFILLTVWLFARQITRGRLTEVFQQLVV